MKTIRVHTDHARRAINAIVEYELADLPSSRRESIADLLLVRQLEWGRVVVLGDRARRAVLEVVSRGEGSNAQGETQEE